MGEAAAMRSFVQVRNGPPEAVMVILVTSETRPSPSAWGQGIVLGIDRQQRRLEPRGIAHEGVAGADEALLVGEGDGTSEAQGRMGRAQARRTAHRSHDDVGITSHGFEDGAVACPVGDAGAGQRLAQGGSLALVGERGEIRADLTGELCQGGGIAATDEGADPEALGMLGQQVGGGTTDGPGGAEDGDGMGQRIDSFRPPPSGGQRDKGRRERPRRRSRRADP